MQRIVVMNAKGGCGKTTVASNLASWLSSRGYATALFDCDPQGSAMRWLRLRPPNLPVIHGIAAYQTGPTNVTRTWQLRVPAETQRIVIDSPAGLKGQELVEQVRNVDVIIIPVVPSPIDIFSTADFIRDLMLVGKVRLASTRIGIVATRVKAKTLSLQSLERFLQRLNIPVIARLRDTQHYLHAVEQGVSIHELTSPRARPDKRDWERIVGWIDSQPEPSLTVVRPTDPDGHGATRPASVGRFPRGQ